MGRPRQSIVKRLSLDGSIESRAPTLSLDWEAGLASGPLRSPFCPHVSPGIVMPPHRGCSLKARLSLDALRLLGKQKRPTFLFRNGVITLKPPISSLSQKGCWAFYFALLMPQGTCVLQAARPCPLSSFSHALFLLTPASTALDGS